MVNVSIMALTLVDLAAGVGGRPDAVPLGEVPVDVHADAAAAGDGDRVLPPEPVVAPRVLVPVGVGEGDDVPLELGNVVPPPTLQKSSASLAILFAQIAVANRSGSRYYNFEALYMHK